MPRKRRALLTDDKLAFIQKVAIYIRVSTQWQIDKASLPVQREELINYCKYALGIEAYDVFEDAGYSAKNTDRPRYQQMMARIRTGEFSHVLVWKIDRISRNLLDFVQMYEELQKLGVTFVSKNEQFDTSSAIGEAMLRIILVFAELERKMTSERVSAVMVSRAAKGDWNGGKVPYGYNYDKEARAFTVNEAEANVVRMIYDMYETERSLLVVSRWLNERGYRPHSGKPWSPVTARNILINPFYIGVYQYNVRREANGGGRTPTAFRNQDDVVLVENHHPAIVEKEQQDAVIAILQSNIRSQMNGTATYQRKNIHIFAGLLRCGSCGSNMVASADRERASGWTPSHYICSRRRRFNDCQNKFVSDITIGPFAMNYIANIIKASKSFGKSTSIETLEKKLLRGPVFEHVVGIERPGLEELYDHLQSGLGPLDYKRVPEADPSSATARGEREILLSEKRRLDRALSRLQSLYLYSEDTMSETDYIIKRQELLSNLEDVEARLNEIEDSLADDLSMSDDEFMAKASYFLMAQQLTSKRNINYETFIKTADCKIIKDFMNNITQNFCIQNGLIQSILFKNGIEHKFIYDS